MKISSIISSVSFSGRREDRNTTSQLVQNNDYSLTENNRKKIKAAIQHLGNEAGEQNIEFLLNVARNLQYGTNIDTVNRPEINWKDELKNAAERSLAVSDPILRKKFQPEIYRLFYSQRPLSPDEKEILASKKRILAKIDKSELENQKNKNISDVENNLDYFISSSNIPIKQKKYILNRFEYLLSPDYSINPRLENKRTLVLAEMLNDLVVDTQATDVPNTKAINQKQHGMCAAISIARKLMSYEYKTDYVDSILSELDDSPQMLIYDLAHTGSGKKVPVDKAEVDYDEALAKGYRIVDAAATQWMNAADMYGMDYRSENVYTPFDVRHLGTFQDSHFMRPMENPNLTAKHSYYQALIKAKEYITEAKAAKLSKRYGDFDRENRINSDIKLISELNRSLALKIKKILPSLSPEQLHLVVKRVNSLLVHYSSDIDKKAENERRYYFIPNEESKIKENKIKQFLKDTYKDKLNLSELEANVKDLSDIIEMTSLLQDALKPKSAISKKIAYDRKLFNAAAAYRTSILFALNDWDMKRDYMVHLNIPDESSLLISTLEKTIEHIKKTNDPVYLNHYAQIFGVEPDKEQITEQLNYINNSVKISLTKTMDEFYEALGIGDRKTALLNNVKALKYEIEHGNKKELENSSITLGVEKNKEKILKIYDEYEKILSSNPTEEQYTKIFNKVGNKSILYTYAQDFEVITEALNNPEEEIYAELIKKFNTVHGLPEDAPVQQSRAVLEMIGDRFNSMSVNISTIRDILTVVDDKGVLLSSAAPNAVILKTLENQGNIISIPELWMLKKRYDAIDKVRSQDEFSSRQGKISNPELYKYTDAEKNTLKKINKLLNYMASEINKDLILTYREIRIPLREHARQIGVNSGSYWNTQEGSSGLNYFQQTKILQELTDKPYQAVRDLDKAVNIIKNSPHSGISSTSVFHNKPGWHAQYISEIAEKDGKDIVFHDNSWGASEHENVWVDSSGLTRTDYSDNRGGELGYITDKKWRNGNYLENLTLKTGVNKPEHVKPKMLRKLKSSGFDDEEYKFPLMNEIILPGVDEEANNLAAGIKDTIFLPDTVFISDLKNMASNMTLAEIKSSQLKSELAGLSYKKELKEINSRLNKTPFNKGISTKEEFDALSDDDVLKVAFEKAALIASYDYVPINKKLAAINSVRDLNKFREKIKKTARKNFDYAFSKSPEILYVYFKNRNKSNILPIIEKALEDNKIKPDEKTKIKIIKYIGEYSKAEQKAFDGSLKNTIDFLVNKLMTRLDDNLPPSPARESAKAQIKKELTEDLKQVLYFNAHDLEKNTEKFNAIKKYIDKKYNPKTDEEFIEIYKKLQDMTLEEFKKETSDVKDEDMALKNISGYSMLQKYNATNEEVQSLVENIIFQKYFYHDLNMSETEPSFRYKKLEKKVRGAYYSKGRTYDDLYRSFRFTLSALNLEKLFNKYSDINYRKYLALPAYPKVNILADNKILEMTDRFDDTVNDSINRIKAKKLNLLVYGLTQRADELLNSLPDDKRLTDKQRKMMHNYAGEFVTANYNDEPLKKSLNAALTILEMENSNLTVRDYKEEFKPWKDEIRKIQNMNTEEIIKESIKSDLEGLHGFINMVVASNFPVKYRSIIKKDINNWLNEELKYNTSPYDKTLEYRNLEKKILNSLVSGADKKAVDNFFNDMAMSIMNLKKTKTGIENNTDAQTLAFEKLMNNILAISDKFLSYEEYKEFAESIVNYAGNETELKTEDIQSYVINDIAERTGIPYNQLSADKKVKQLIKSLSGYHKISMNGAKYKKNIEKEKALLLQITEKFIADNIKPENKEAVQIKIRDYLIYNLKKSDKNTYNEEKAVFAHEKFIEDYRKYHVLNHPEAILKRYTELLAKDGPIAKEKNPAIKNRLKVELGQYESYLEMALSLSNLVEVQEQLMEAVRLGNPGLVASKFKNFDTSLIDESGTFATMADPEAVDYMVRRLIIENDDSTAILFVEKLGLTEKFLKVEDEYMDFKNYKANIDKIGKSISNTNAQIGIITEELKNLCDSIDNCADNDKSYVNKIDETKNNIIEKTKHLTGKNNIKKVLLMLDNVKSIIDANPNLEKSVVVEQGSDIVKSEIVKSINEKMQDLRVPLTNAYMIYNMIAKLAVKEGSEEERIKNHIMESYDKIEKYNEKVMYSVMKSANNLSVDIKTL